MTLRIHNTLTRALEPFSPLEPGHVRMYVCGMTVYDLCHLGHARSMVAFDVVQRWLKGVVFKWWPQALNVATSLASKCTSDKKSTMRQFDGAII